MNKKLEEELFAIEPKWFDRDPKSQNSLMSYGFTCGDGWFTLVRSLLVLAKRMQDSWATGENGPHNPFEKFQVVQVKEKFGTLRFYYEDGGDEAFQGAVALASMMSGCICEECGNAAKRRNVRAWLATLCDKCAAERRRKR